MDVGIDLDEQKVFITIGDGINVTAKLSPDTADLIAAQLKSSAQIIREHTPDNGTRRNSQSL